MTLFKGNLPQNDREKERERERASWMPNAMVTAGNRAPQVEFPSSVFPVLWMCTTVFAWFTPSLMDCCVWSQVIAFGGCPICFTVFRAHLWQKKNLQYQSSLQPFSPWLICIYNIYVERERLADQSSFFVATTQPIQGWPSKLAQIQNLQVGTKNRATEHTSDQLPIVF